MDRQEWVKVMSVAVVPVVIISASALMCLALYNRLASVVSRLRAFQRERLAAQENIARHANQSASEANGGEFAEPNAHERRHREIETLLREQTDRVIRRARLLRATLLFLLSAIGSLVACSILIGVSVFWSAAIYFAVALFFVGMSLLLAGVFCAIGEMRRALDPVELEMEVVARLSEQPVGAPADSPDAT
jgi:hypothetical protein